MYGYDECNRLIDEVTDESKTLYIYDAQGNMLTQTRQVNDVDSLVKKYVYNGFQQNIQTDIMRIVEDRQETSFQRNIYDAERIRCGIDEDGRVTHFITNGWDNFTELDEKQEVIKRIIRGVGIVASEDYNAYDTDVTGEVKAKNNYHYYHGNERCDVEYITDKKSRVVNAYHYDAFGAITSSEEEINNRYTYNGEAYDKVSGQYYLRARYYSPRVSRFMQEDTYRGDGLNLYAFCANNPVMYVDPSGYARSPKPPRADWGTGDTPQAIADAKNGVSTSYSNDYVYIMLKWK